MDGYSRKDKMADLNIELKEGINNSRKSTNAISNTIMKMGLTLSDWMKNSGGHSLHNDSMKYHLHTGNTQSTENERSLIHDGRM